jgi:outer membrane protein OmpA-like peptidoglycan-associated protein
MTHSGTPSDPGILPSAVRLGPSRIAALILTLVLIWLLPAASPAQDNPFAGGWTLRADTSSLSFQSVKNQTKVETSGFATFSGGIDETGLATVVVEIDSVDTKVDLRNVRMRFLFFETFQFPQAVVTVKLDPSQLAGLTESRRMTMTLPFTLTLHGVTKDLSAEVAVVLISADLVAVSSVAPVSIAVGDFNLADGLAKLEDAAKVEVIPSGAVTFDFLFARNTATGGTETVATGPGTTPGAGAAAALENKGDFAAEECVGRFEILSRSRSITFASASARLSPESGAFLDALYDIVRRCPGMRIEVGGHTDSDGSDATNQKLSEKRAAAVADYLVAKGIPADRLVPRGFGESQPLTGNDTAAGKAKNRRIEFVVISGG